VVNGAFRIDSELQIRGRPSMMAPAGEGAPGQHEHGSLDGPAILSPPKRALPAGARGAVGELFKAYFATGTALAADDHPAAISEAARTRKALEAAADHLPEKPREAAADALARLSKAKDLAAARVPFEPLSEAMTAIVLEVGAGDAGPIYPAFCPMAFDDRGARWLQGGEVLANPYFGSEMLRCGDLGEPVVAR
jgi:membrane fusion protein, copper/silver efflux system